MKIIEVTSKEVEKNHERFVALLKQSFIQSFPNEDFDINSFHTRINLLKEYLNESKAVVYSCVIEEEVAGFVWFFEKNNSGQKSLHINHFVVHENFRRLGIGKTLWDSVESFVINSEINEIELLVTKDSEEAVNFYTKRNFKVERFFMKKRY